MGFQTDKDSLYLETNASERSLALHVTLFHLWWWETQRMDFSYCTDVGIKPRLDEPAPYPWGYFTSVWSKHEPFSKYLQKNKRPCTSFWQSHKNLLLQLYGCHSSVAMVTHSQIFYPFCRRFHELKCFRNGSRDMSWYIIITSEHQILCIRQPVNWLCGSSWLYMNKNNVFDAD